MAPSIQEVTEQILGGQTTGQTQSANTQTTGSIQDITNQILGQSQQTQPTAPRGSFGQVLPQIGGKPKSPLSFWQEISFSGAGDDKELQMKFLKQMLPDSEVGFDEDGDLTVDGNRLNPKGFDFGDLTRNTLDAIPLFAQIGGSIAGATAGATAGGVGAIPGAVIGGTAAATAGRGVQLAIADAFGMDVDGRDYIRVLGNSAKVALTGEVVGAGLGIVGGKVIKPLAGKIGSSKMAKGASNAWTSMLTKLRKSAPGVIEYISGADKSAIKYALDQNINGGQTISQVLDPKFFDTRYGGEMSSRLLFNESIENAIGSFDVGTKKVSKSIRLLVDNVIKNKNKVATKELIKEISNGKIDDGLLNHISKQAKVDDIFSVKNLDKDAPLNLAKKFMDSIEGESKMLGKKISENRNKALKNFRGKKVDIETGSTMTAIREMLDDAVAPARVGAEPGRLGPLKQIDDILERFAIEDVSIEPGTFSSISESMKLNTIMDDVADSLSKNKVIPDRIKGKFYEIHKNFSKEIDRTLGLEEVNGAFNEFLNIVEAGKFNASTSLEMLETRFANIEGQSRFFVNAVDDVLSSMGKSKGIPLLDDINNYMYAKKLMDLDSAGVPKSMLTGMTDIVNNSAFLSGKGDSAKEFILKRISGIMKNEGGEDFFKNILNKETAVAFSGSNPNVLRVSSILGMAGLGIGGPLGGMIGLASGTALTPNGIKKGLVAFDKMAQKKMLEKTAAKTSKAVSSEKSVATARALLGRLLQDKENQ
jgi:hypothetical protein